MKHLEKLNTTDLEREHDESRAALRLAAYHGAQIPDGAKDALKAMAAELRRRSASTSDAASAGNEE